MMRPREILLALFVVVAWGVNFVIIEVGLGTMPPLLLAALRFAVAALPAIFIPRPQVPWPRFIFLGIVLFTGQFGLLFLSMKVGMPAGLASVVIQSQAFLTGPIAALVLGEKIGIRQMSGTGIAFLGLAAIATTAGGGGVTLAGLLLCLGAALCWAVGNVALRGAGKIDMFAMVTWLSIVPPLPLLILSYLFEGPQAIEAAFLHMGWAGIGAVAYIAIVSTNIGYGIWAYLLKLYPAAQVAPFSLLVPIVGIVSAALLLGEQFGPVRLAGMVLVFAGLIVAVFPFGRLVSRGSRMSG
ncbi:EamA family transporter [Rhizobium sp. C1]|uniref:EamA family transporter n=1 Tax=Rhizobium sp. C1 TaxID=1349799 RepID=UPI001E630129|nr:EamA family transporter [Rhizobium sp. C1]MCD2179188.1 EamA family transporter [Rhizobium sp. C1]